MGKIKYLIVNTKAETRNGMFKEVSEFAVSKGLVTSALKLEEGFLKREKEGTTAFKHQMAIPHTHIPEVKEAAIIIARNDHDLMWSSIDGKKTKTAVCIIVPANEKIGTVHMNMLSKVAEHLMDHNKRKIYRLGTLEDIQKLS